MLHALMGEIHNSRYELDEAVAAVRRGLAELGRPLPTNPVLLVITTIGLFVAGLLVKWLRLGFGTATGEQRERYQLEASLNGVPPWRRLRPAVAADVLPSLPWDLSVQSVGHLARIRPCIHPPSRGTADGWPAPPKRPALFKRMYANAAGLGDPQTMAYVTWSDGITRNAVRLDEVDAREMLRRVLTEHGRWLNAQEYLWAASGLCHNLTLLRLPAGVAGLVRASTRTGGQPRAGARSRSSWPAPPLGDARPQRGRG